MSCCQLKLESHYICTGTYFTREGGNGEAVEIGPWIRNQKTVVWKVEEGEVLSRAGETSRTIQGS